MLPSGKWKERREVVILTTKHSDEMGKEGSVN